MYTVENAVIIPLFFGIVMILIYLCFYVHDAVVFKGTALKLAADTEFEESRVFELKQEELEYAGQKSILSKDIRITVENKNDLWIAACGGEFLNRTYFGIKFKPPVHISEVAENNVQDFIRMLCAVEDVINGE